MHYIKTRILSVALLFHLQPACFDMAPNDGTYLCNIFVLGSTRFYSMRPGFHIQYKSRTIVRVSCPWFNIDVLLLVKHRPFDEPFQPPLSLMD